MIRVAIIGSRDFGNLDLVRQYVRSLPRDTVVVSGGAQGVDEVAEDEARKLRLCRCVHEPITSPRQSRSEYIFALFARNERIAHDCDRVVAFWDRKSTGTSKMIEFARSLGKSIEIRTEGGGVVRLSGDREDGK